MKDIEVRYLGSANSAELIDLLSHQSREEVQMFAAPHLLNHQEAEEAIVLQLIEHWLETQSICIIGAFEQQQLVGFISAQIRPDIFNSAPILAGEILAVYVRQEVRKQGLGRLLITNVHQWFAENRVAIANVSWLLGNAASQRLYESFGYAPMYVTGRKLL